MNPTQRIAAALASAFVLALLALPLIGSGGHESTVRGSVAPAPVSPIASAETPQDQQWDMMYGDGPAR